MILKGSQRSGGRDLAAHLMRVDDNEHVSLHELRGFVSRDLRGAFQEAEAISSGTRCRQYLFSLSLSPPADQSVPVEVFEDTIARIEKRLGLEGQPRAVVFHEKEGRRHAHCVWSRIDAETMTARPMSFFKTKLMGVSRDPYLENGWKMPRGLENAGERNPTNFSLAEWQQAKRQGMDPRWLKSTLQDCWKRSDNAASFQRALQDRGFFLAKGDKRGLVVLDHTGEVHSLPRMLDLKTKEVRDRLGPGDDLPGVDATRKVISERMTPAIRRHIEESRGRFRDRSAVLGQKRADMTKAHRDARAGQEAGHSRERDAGARERAARLPKGLRGLWHRITGKYQEVRAANEAEALAQRERQVSERGKLIDEQLRQRALLQTQFKELRKQQAQQLLELRGDIGRFLKLTRGPTGHRPRGKSQLVSDCNDRTNREKAMSSRDDDSSAGLAIVGASLAIVGLLLFAVAAFVAIGITILCLFAWRKPLTLFKLTMTPEEAHTFVYSALGGTMLLPTFVAFASALYQFQVVGMYWGYIFLAGYVLGGFASMFWLSHLEEEQRRRRPRSPLCRRSAFP